MRFCKRDGRSTVKLLGEVRVLPLGRFTAIDLTAREFLMNMVRRIVAAVQGVGEGRWSIEEVERALAGEDIMFGLASPENLCLMDIQYGFDFDIECPPTLRRKVTRREEDLFLRMEFYRILGDICSR